MSLPIKQKLSARDIALMGVFLALILALGLIERLIPIDLMVPGVKLGLSNVVVMLAIYYFSFPKTLCLVLLKCILLAVFTGNAVGFFYSLSGSLLSFLAMWLIVRLGREHVSPLGVSVVGAACHSSGQILVACFLLGSRAILAYLPILLIISVATGLIVGFFVKALLPRVGAVLQRQFYHAAGSVWKRRADKTT